MKCRWDAPDGALSVELGCAIVEAIKARTIDAFVSLPRRGAETGGLLYGRFDTKTRTVTVEEFEEIPCEHRFGPSYVLSDGDKAALSRALLQPDDALPAVGFYRSYTGRPAELDEADIALIHTYFLHPPYLFLLISPLSPDQCQASFLLWQEGEELGSIPANPPFLLDPQQLAVAAPAAQDPLARRRETDPSLSDLPRRGRTTLYQSRATNLALRPEIFGQGVEERPAELPVEEPFIPPPPAEPLGELPFPKYSPRLAAARAGEETRPRPKRRFWLPLAACVVAAIGAAFLYEWWTVARPPRVLELALDARENASRLELQWDGASPAARDASRGLLFITDGPLRQEVRLGPAEIHSGKYAYQTMHPNVLFRIELFSGRSQASHGTLRVLQREAPAPPPPTQTASVAPPVASTGQADRLETQAGVTPPSPVHQVQPGIPAGIRTRIKDRIVIPVDVRVNARGRVIKATAQGEGDATFRYLAGRATAAARLWRFSPARSKSGRAVAGSKTVYFVFGGA